MTVRQAAERLGLCYDTTLILVTAGRIPATNISTGKTNKRWLITEEGLQEFLRPTNTPPPRQPLPPRRKPVPDYVDDPPVSRRGTAARRGVR